MCRTAASSCLISQKPEPASVEFDYRNRGVLTGSPAGCILLSAFVPFMVGEKGRKARYRIGNCLCYWQSLKWYLFGYTHFQPEDSFLQQMEGGEHINARIKHILMLLNSVHWSLFYNHVVCRHIFCPYIGAYLEQFIRKNKSFLWL